MTPSISVIIPNYNGRKLLEENLPSVISALKFACKDYEIIVSDDASEDDSVPFLHKKYPEIIVLTTEKNKGFSATANRGIYQAKKKLSFILNSDVKLAKNYFTFQFRYFERSDTFGVMGSICSPEGKLIDAAKYPQWRSFQVKSTLNFSLLNAPEGFLIPTYFLSGANAFVDTEKLKKLNGFNEIYSPFYMEDVDLSVRAWRMGWKCYYEPKAICFHNISNTINKHHSANIVRLTSKRNKFIFHEIHLNGSKKLLWKMKIFFSLIFRFLILDFDFYKAYRKFRRIKVQAEKSKKISQSKSYVKTIEQVVGGIQRDVKEYKKRFF